MLCLWELYTAKPPSSSYPTNFHRKQIPFQHVYWAEYVPPRTFNYGLMNARWLVPICERSEAGLGTVIEHHQTMTTNITNRAGSSALIVEDCDYHYTRVHCRVHSPCATVTVLLLG